jgi:hypothetical protein
MAAVAMGRSNQEQSEHEHEHWRERKHPHCHGSASAAAEVQRVPNTWVKRISYRLLSFGWLEPRAAHMSRRRCVIGRPAGVRGIYRKPGVGTKLDWGECGCHRSARSRAAPRERRFSRLSGA